MRVHVYKRADKKWAWRLVAGNGQIIATDGGQGYEHRSDAFETVRSIVQGDYQDIDILIQGTDFKEMSELEGVEDTTEPPSMGLEGQSEAAGTPQ